MPLHHGGMRLQAYLAKGYAPPQDIIWDHISVCTTIIRIVVVEIQR